PGSHYGVRPVFVLVGARTFSGAEEFAYNLQALGRGTVIGEPTGGGAHHEMWFQVQRNFRVSIPTGRAVNPITGTNWEGTGVTPAVHVPACRALAEAHRLALESGLADDLGPELRRETEAALAEILTDG